MTYLLTLSRDAHLTLATTRAVVPAEQFAPLQDAMALVSRLSELLAGEQAAQARAQAEASVAGQAAGYAQGQTRARDEAAAALAETVQGLAAEQAQQREELRQALVALACGMVRRMAVDLAPEQVLAALAERALDQVVPPQPVRLRLPVDLVEPVRQQLARRELTLSVQCVADERLSGLQCTIESAAGLLLAGLDDMLARVADSLATSQRARSGAEPQAVEP